MQQYNYPTTIYCGRGSVTALADTLAQKKHRRTLIVTDRWIARVGTRNVASRAAVAFAMHPVEVEDLLAVSDAERLMPPKSTWFEQKLLSGLLVHVF